MIDFNEFVRNVKIGVMSKMGDQYEVVVESILKNNGVILTGLVVKERGSSVSPVIYLNSLYQAYMAKGEHDALDTIVASIVRSYWENHLETSLQHLSFKNPADINEVKDKIVYKLINTKKNEALLKQIPSIPFHDLSIVFMLYLEESESGISTALIHNKHMVPWGTTVNDLYRMAKENTPRLMPEILTGIEEVIQRMAGGIIGEGQEGVLEHEPEMEEIPFYVLTNHAGINGAACLLYPGVLKKCAEKLESDLLILPSSVHEILLIPYNEVINTEEMRLMVRSINASEVPEVDCLSGQVYLYYRSDNQVVIAA